MTRRGSISTVLLRPLAFALAEVPGALPAFFAATDLTPETLADADARVSPAQFCVAWSEAVRLRGDPSLALAIAHATPPGAFGIVEYVCRSAPTVGDALRQWCRYLRILDDAVEVGLVEVGPHATALRVVRESEAPAPASHELCFALVLHRARAMLGSDPRVVEVSFAHRAGAAHVARCRELFATRVQFGAPETEMVFTREILAEPLTTADPHLYAILGPTAESLAAAATPEALVTDQARRAIQRARSLEDTDVEAIARSLGMTARTLQRRLKDEGTGFQALRDDTRRAQAEAYLRKGMSFAEISFLLGFSEPSAFFRAFKRWTGHTPLEGRARLGLTPAGA